MAITIPYPDLVFVPLDKLTAEEMNEIVANYTAIANEAGKALVLDTTLSSSKKLAGTDAAYLSLDISQIPTGAKFLAFAQSQIYGGGGSTFYKVYMRYNGVSTPGRFSSESSQSIETSIRAFTKAASASTIELVGSDTDTKAEVQQAYLGVMVAG